MNCSNRKIVQNVPVFLNLILLMAICMIVLTGCGMDNGMSDMPFNGEVFFHDLSIEIPEDFIRDSTKSNENQYVFEKDNYNVVIVLSKQNTNGYSLRNIVNGAESENGTVLNYDDEYTTCDIEYILSDGTYSYTHSQIYNDDRYQIIVQGKNEADVKSVYDTVMAEAVIGGEVD